VIPGIPLSILTAVYTAYLFGQAKARDMWQNPLLPPHLLVQALLLGAITLIVFVLLGVSSPIQSISWIYILALSFHFLCVLGEITLTHPTAHARLAVREMVWGRYRRWFWLGMAITLFALLMLGVVALANAQILLRGPLVFYLLWVSIPAAALGILSHEHAYVQAGQSVPLA